MTVSTGNKNAPKSTAKAPASPAKAAPAPTPAKPGKKAYTPEERAAADKAAKQKLEAFNALPPAGKAKVYLDNGWKRLESTFESLRPFDVEGVIKAAWEAITEALGSVNDHLDGLPEEFRPLRAARGPGAARFSEGSEVHFKTARYEAAWRVRFSSQGPHRIAEVLEDGMVMLTDNKGRLIGIPRGEVTALSAIDQAKAYEAWKETHKDDPRIAGKNGKSKN